MAVLPVLAGLALLLAGCPTPPKPPPRLTPLAAGERFLPLSLPAAASSETPAQNILITPEPMLAAPRDQWDSVLPEENLQLGAGMLPLAAWAQLCGFSEVRIVPNANPRTVELLNEQGTLTLAQGQRFARWNGVGLGLGFAPGVAGGEIGAHSVDVAKTIYPLALGVFPFPAENRVLVLDPGHGGPDPGSRCAGGGCFEKNLALDWALRIERMLAGSSWRVVLTRREDRELSLLERVAIADAERASLFISLHFNAHARVGSGEEETGIETYCLTPAGAPSNITRNFEDDVRRAYPNNQFDAQNILLAARLHAAMLRATGRKDRGVRRARFMTVLREQKRPAVLIEGGFLSSAAESRVIAQSAHLELMARAVCDALPN